MQSAAKSSLTAPGRESLIRVALFTNTYKPIINGIVASMEVLRAFLESEGHQVIVVAPRYPGHADPDGFVHRFPSVVPPARVRFPLAVPLAPRLSRRIAALGIDVFHTHHPFGMGVIARRMAARVGRPLVTTIHTQYEEYLHYFPVPRDVLRPIVRHLVRSYCDSCQMVTSPAHGMAAVIRDYGVSTPVTVVPNGVALQRYRQARGEEIRRQFGLTDRETLGLFTGRIAPEKNLPALLAMVRLVSGEHPGFRLMVLGDGPELPALQRLAQEMGIGSRVLFPGAVPHEAVPPYCAAADLFLTASTTEVNPTSVIEAMAAGTPVVAYDTFGAREILNPEEDGLLTAHEPEALAEAVTGLLAHPGRLARMAETAARNAERFSPAATGRAMLAVYEEARTRLHRGRTAVKV